MTYTETECLQACADFPSLARSFNGHPIAFLDGPGGTQVPESVLNAVRDSYVERNANFDGMFSTSIDVTAAVAEARNAVADFLGAESGADISFGANMTTINFSLSHALVRSMSPGDEVVITQLDHEANRGPWLNLQERGIVVREVRLNPDGHLDLDDLARQVNTRTRVVALGIASNSIGTVTALTQARELCTDVGAYLVVDAVHYAAHFPLDVVALGIDFLLCSAYKFYGPHVGILYSRAGLLDQLETDHLRTQKAVAPYRIETGTLNHAALAGVSAAIEYIAKWGSGESRRERLVSAMHALHRYESDLARHYCTRVKDIAGVTVWGPGFDSGPRAPTVSITIDGHTPEDMARTLAANGLQVWHGHFYAVKVLEVFGLVDRGGLLRVGISMYNTQTEIDRLLSNIEAIASAPAKP
jgi:cysteine desulfurase family protein (TIGR01976 family)